MRSNKALLITGINRSGSTWIGQTLAKSNYVRYVHEPFNVIIAKNKYSYDIPQWFHYVSQGEEKEYRQYIKRILWLSDNPIEDIYKAFGTNSSRPILSRSLRNLFPSIIGVRPIVKDPIAIFSADWLYENFPMDVVVIIRHPAAYVWSVLKDSSHMHSFQRIFFEQPDLLKLTKPFQDDIYLASDESLPLYHRAAIFWKITHHIIKQYQQQYTEWIFIRYEQIASQPIEQFQGLTRRLSLEWTSTMNDYILQRSLNENLAEYNYKAHIKSYNSTEQYMSWKNHLDKTTIQKIRDITQPVSDYFYADDDW